jgi:hypothetical protein
MMPNPATIRLINAAWQHDFVFTATRMNTDFIKVRVECPGAADHEGHPVPAYAECIITAKDSGNLDFDAYGVGTYKAHGTVTWDTHRQVVRFTGDLTLVDVAQARFYETAVVDTPPG